MILKKISNLSDEELNSEIERMETRTDQAAQQAVLMPNIFSADSEAFESVERGVNDILEKGIDPGMFFPEYDMYKKEQQLRRKINERIRKARSSD